MNFNLFYILILHTLSSFIHAFNLGTLVIFYFFFLASPLCSQVANMFLFLSQSKNTAKGIIISIFTKWQSAKDCFISRSHFIKYSERETLRGVSSWVSG